VGDRSTIFARCAPRGQNRAGDPLVSFQGCWPGRTSGPLLTFVREGRAYCVHRCLSLIVTSARPAIPRGCRHVSNRRIPTDRIDPAARFGVSLNQVKFVASQSPQRRGLRYCGWRLRDSRQKSRHLNSVENLPTHGDFKEISGVCHLRLIRRVVCFSLDLTRFHWSTLRVSSQILDVLVSAIVESTSTEAAAPTVGHRPRLALIRIRQSS
jgi:hypothetical protein